MKVGGGNIAEISLFATFYILAQIVERIIELVSEVGYLGKHKTKIEDDKREIEYYQKIIEKKLEKNPDISAIKSESEEIKRIEEGKRTLEMCRIASIWLFASLLGIIVCWVVNVGFFKAIGITETVTSWDKLGSGLLVGSGTKPLHDLIAKIEKTAKK